MLSASVWRIGGFQPLQGAKQRNVLRRHQRREDSRRDGHLVDDGTGTSTTIVHSAAATEAVYALASVAAASSTLILGSLSYNLGEREGQMASRAPEASSTGDSSLKTQPAPAPPPSRLLFVSLSIVSFLPYINFAAFACLAAIESFRNRKGEEEEEEEKRNLSSSPRPRSPAFRSSTLCRLRSSRSPLPPAPKASTLSSPWRA